MSHAIKSCGGPLICLEKSTAKCWLGTGGNSDSNKSAHLRKVDYDRACAVSNYIGILDSAGHQAIVLGDMPLETMVGHFDEQSPYILRIYYMDPGAEPITQLGDGRLIDFSNPLEILEATIEGGDLIIFDSSLPGGACR